MGNIRKVQDIGPKRDKRAQWRLEVSTGEVLPSGAMRKIVRLFPSPPGHGATMAQARDVLEQLSRSVVRSVPDKLRPTPTVAELVEIHLDALRDESGRAPRTIASYRNYASNWIEPRIGTKRISAVTKSDIDGIVREMRAGGRASSSINQVRVLLSGMFARACQLGLLDRSPVEHAVKVSVTRKRLDIPDDETVQRLLNAAASDRVTLVAIRLAAMLSARRGEIVGLQWGDVHGSTIDVVRALTYDDGAVVVKSTKGGDLRIGVAIDDETARLLDALRASARGPWVVSSDAGLTPWSPDRLSSRWESVRTAAKVSGVRLHDLRHWGATTLLDAGVPPHEVARRLGHSSPTVTLTVYAHARGRDDAANASTLAAALSPKRRHGEPVALEPVDGAVCAAVDLAGDAGEIASIGEGVQSAGTPEPARRAPGVVDRFEHLRVIDEVEP